MKMPPLRADTINELRDDLAILRYQRDAHLAMGLSVWARAISEEITRVRCELVRREEEKYLLTS